MAQRAPVNGQANVPTVIWLADVDESAADRLPDEFWQIRARVGGLLGLQHLDEDPYKGSFLSYIAPGRGCTRTAILLAAGGRQGTPPAALQRAAAPTGVRRFARDRVVVKSTSRNVMWAFFPSELVHAATEVRGGEHRGLLSFGYVVRADAVWRRRYRLTSGFITEYTLEDGPGSVRRLLDALAAAPEAKAIDSVRHEVFAFLLSAGETSVEEAATDLGRAPDELWPVVRDLERHDGDREHGNPRSSLPDDTGVSIVDPALLDRLEDQYRRLIGSARRAAGPDLRSRAEHLAGEYARTGFVKVLGVLPAESLVAFCADLFAVLIAVAEPVVLRHEPTPHGQLTDGACFARVDPECSRRARRSPGCSTCSGCAHSANCTRCGCRRWCTASPAMSTTAGSTATCTARATTSVSTTITMSATASTSSSPRRSGLVAACVCCPTVS